MKRILMVISQMYSILLSVLFATMFVGFLHVDIAQASVSGKNDVVFVIGPNALDNVLIPRVERAETTVVAVTDQPFSEAVRVTTLIVPEASYHIQLQVPTNEEIRKGDSLVLTFYVRGIATDASSGRIQLAYGFEQRTPPHRNEFFESFSVPADGKWVRVQKSFVSKMEHDAKASQLAIRLGFQLQTVEIGGIEVVNHGPGD